MDLFSSLNSKPERIHLNLINSDIEYYPSLFTKQESVELFKTLIDKIHWQQETIKYFGKIIPLPRLTSWYGHANKTYTYSGIEMKPNDWISELIIIKKRIEEIAKIDFTNVLLNMYRNGNDSVSWHSDNEPELGTNPCIGSVSFGASRIFQLKHILEPSNKKSIKLQDGSFLLMKGETQHYWQHQIPKTSKNISSRINLTFRVIN